MVDVNSSICLDNFQVTYLGYESIYNILESYKFSINNKFEAKCQCKCQYGKYLIGDDMDIISNTSNLIRKHIFSGICGKQTTYQTNCGIKVKPVNPWRAVKIDTLNKHITFKFRISMIGGDKSEVIHARYPYIFNLNLPNNKKALIRLNPNGLNFKSLDPWLILDSDGNSYNVESNLINLANEFNPNKIGWIKLNNSSESILDSNWIGDKIKVKVLNCELQKFRVSFHGSNGLTPNMMKHLDGISVIGNSNLIQEKSFQIKELFVELKKAKTLEGDLNSKIKNVNLINRGRSLEMKLELEMEGQFKYGTLLIGQILVFSKDFLVKK